MFDSISFFRDNPFKSEDVALPRGLDSTTGIQHLAQGLHIAKNIPQVTDRTRGTLNVPITTERPHQNASGTRAPCNQKRSSLGRDNLRGVTQKARSGQTNVKSRFQRTTMVGRGHAMTQ